MWEEIEAELFGWKDEKYGEFQRRLIPTVAPERIIGVRTPKLREMAKQISKRKDWQLLLQELPHQYFEENQLHGFLISGMRDFDQCIEALEQFLPFVDNWATCDHMSPKVLKKNPERILPRIESWIRSKDVYTVRFGVGMLMQHFLDEQFQVHYAQLIQEICMDEYYVNMMRAWYFATALAKQYQQILPFFQERRLDRWTHNKAIQKAVESYRITEEQKQELRTLRWK